MRSALVFWGHNPPPELHSIVDDGSGRRIVTWADVMNLRRQRQRSRLELIRDVPVWRAYRLWVGYFDQDLMGGWHAFLNDHRGDGYRIWIDRDRSWLIPRLLAEFPLVSAVGTEHEQWGRWKISFATKFERRRQDGEAVGVLPVWWNRRDSPCEKYPYQHVQKHRAMRAGARNDRATASAAGDF